MSLADAILLTVSASGLTAAMTFVFTVWLGDRERARWRCRAGAESAARIECQERHWADNEAHAILIRSLERERDELYAELEATRRGHARPRAMAPRVVA